MVTKNKSLGKIFVALVFVGDTTLTSILYLLISAYLSAYLSVLRVFSLQDLLGDIVAIIQV